MSRLRDHFQFETAFTVAALAFALIRAWLGRSQTAPHLKLLPNLQMLLAGAHALKEVVPVRLAAHAVRPSRRLAIQRVARSRFATR